MNRFLYISLTALLVSVSMAHVDSAWGQNDELVMSIDRDDGSTTIDNPSGNPVVIDLYYVQSVVGSIDPSGWLSLDDQGLDGDTWRVTGEPPTGTANVIAELNPDTASTLGAFSTTSIGAIFVPNFMEFGEDPEDLLFTYGTPAGDEIQGVVNYSGTKQHNNIVLTVDAGTGAAMMQNESPFSVEIDSYFISSSDDALLSGDGQWNSLQDQGAGDGDWFESDNVGPSLLSELQRDGTTLLNNGDAFPLGTIFNTAKSQQLDFEFLMAGESEFFPGVVVFTGSTAAVPGDYNRNNIVDAADYTVWRDMLGQSVAPGEGADGDGDGMITAADYDFWKARFGNVSGSGAAQVSAVPEPSGVLLCTLGIACAVSCRRAGRPTIHIVD